MSAPAGSPNWSNQTIWTGDNLDIMRGMNSASVDLIYLDPPFNSKANYAAPIGSKAAGAAFKDTWGLDDVNLAWHGEIKHEHPGLYSLLTTTREINGDSMMSYLIYMAVRIMEMSRLLKPTGSIYLHCDPTASHYIKVMMDAIFGHEYYRNEIVWKRTSTHSDSKTWSRVSDTILFYTKGKKFAWNAPHTPHSEEYIASKYRHHGADGRLYRLDNMTSPNPRPNMMYEWKGFPSPTKGWRYSEARMAELDVDGRIWYPTFKNGEYDLSRRPQLKRYLDEMKGAAMGNIWTGIPPINSQARERLGYPTQKPLALIRRIIEASSNKGDVVIDPFCGCATACIAAELEHRQWVGIDISAKAAALVKDRMEREVRLFYQGAHRTDIPARTDLGKIIRYSDEKNRRWLYGEQGGYCNGCEEHFAPRNMTVDHIIPRAKGGTDHISNLQLLCGACNSLKGDRPHEYLLACLTDKGWIKRKKAA